MGDPQWKRRVQLYDGHGHWNGLLGRQARQGELHTAYPKSLRSFQRKVSNPAAELATAAMHLMIFVAFPRPWALSPEELPPAFGARPSAETAVQTINELRLDASRS